MRPRRTLRGFAAAALCCILGASAAVGAASGATEAELKDLRARIDQLQRSLSSAEETRGEAAGELRANARALSDAHRALFALAARRGALESELAAIASQQRDLRSRIADQEALAAKLLRLQYEQGTPDRLRLALEGRDAATVARHIAYYGYIQQARARVVAELRARADELAKLEGDARARRDELAQNQRLREEEARRLEKERAARAALLTRLAGDIARGRREIGRLKRDEARLSRLVEEIAKALAAKPAESERLPGRTIERAADATSAFKPFKSLKGSLQLPVRGELANRFGTAREETGVNWKGLFIRCISGEIVHAVADGRVVYADWLRGFGNLLILDHGQGFMSLYANNEGLLRQVGETVRGGDPVARVGATGGDAESGLYFELRRGGKPFDPLVWVAP